jgi:cellulose synthase/poly-beta-1,6-N-acetylglucosamine synthase-like glycosyltransferase
MALFRSDLEDSGVSRRNASQVVTADRAPPARTGADELFLASLLIPDFADWKPVLGRLGLSLDAASRIAMQAGVNGTDFQTELLASGEVAEIEFFRALAVELGLPFVAEIDPDKMIVREADCVALLKKRGGHKPVKLEEASGVTCLIAPERTRISQMREMFRQRPALRGRLKITTSGALRKAAQQRAQPLLSRLAARGLFERYPQYSALIVANAWQGWLCGALFVTLAVALMLAPEAAQFAAHLFFSVFFLACVALRLVALQQVVPLRNASVPRPVRADMPVYSVLVALYDEAEIVPDLLKALDAIVWPRSKLEIKLVCEADDAATLAALRALPLPPHIEVIETPVGGPRTKPKALSYALPVVSGEFVVLYDAEDRLHPLQLVQAWQRFSQSGEDLACLQAPLEIANRHTSMIARMFFFEYAALFRGLLPWLARRRLILPLGGTSNHFRRSALEHLGGWDPHNVTEDADLGLRLARFGYRTEIISCPTYEDAPEDFSTWLPQRTRWFKGWSQTWLVHMRQPFRLAKDLGPLSFVLTQVLFAGMVVSAIFHPFLVATALLIVLKLALGGSLSVWQSGLLPIDIVNIVCGYLSFLLLGWQTLEGKERRSFWKIVVFTPVYWMMMSLAAWRSLIQLWSRPHHWEKTPHYKPRPVPPD